MLSKEERIQIEKELTSGEPEEDFFFFWSPLLFIMKPDEAFLFSLFMEKLGLRKRYKNPDRWFRCSLEEIETELNMTRAVQLRVVKSLKKKGFIQTRIAGMPGKREIQINMPLVFEKLRDVGRYQHPQQH